MTDLHLEELIDGKQGIRFGLAAVKNVGEQAAKTIEAARFLTGAFDSIEDMCHRVDTKGTNRRTLESLIKVGAMDSLNPERLSILSGMDRIVSLAQKEARIRESGQRSMFEILTDSVEETQSSLEFESGPLMTDSEKACLVIGAVAIIAVIAAAIFGDDDDDENKTRKGRRGRSGPINIGDRGGNDEPDGPRIYRYKVTISLNELNNDETNVRVSASGEVEQDGKILSTGGIHEAEFFQKFFAGMNQGLFLDQNLPNNN